MRGGSRSGMAQNAIHGHDVAFFQGDGKSGVEAGAVERRQRRVVERGFRHAQLIGRCRVEFQQRARDFRGGALQGLFCGEQGVGVASRGDDIFADNGFRDAGGIGLTHVEGACDVGNGANGVGFFDICLGGGGHIVGSEGGKHRLVAFGKNGAPARMAGEHASAADDANGRRGANDESVAAEHAQRLVEAYLRCGLLVLLEFGVAVHE